VVLPACTKEGFEIVALSAFEIEITFQQIYIRSGCCATASEQCYLHSLQRYLHPPDLAISQIFSCDISYRSPVCTSFLSEIKYWNGAWRNQNIHVIGGIIEGYIETAFEGDFAVEIRCASTHLLRVKNTLLTPGVRRRSAWEPYINSN
jgi:hypothetical protein